MPNLPIELFVSCLGVFLVLQTLSVFLTGLEVAAKQIEGRSTWIARSGEVFEEFAVAELGSSKVMQQEFEETQGGVFFAESLGLQTNG